MTNHSRMKKCKNCGTNLYFIVEDFCMNCYYNEILDKVMNNDEFNNHKLKFIKRVLKW